MNTKVNLVSVSGTKNSGKTTAAEMLQYCLSVPKMFRQYWLFKVVGKIIPKRWKILAFADPLKKMLAVLLNIPVEKFNDRSFKEDTCIDLKTLDYSLASFVKNQYLLSDSKFTKMAKDLDKEILDYHLTIRQLMQFFGTSIMRTYFSEKVGINSTLRNASERTIIADCRFINEAEAIKNNGGIIIYIDRNGAPFGHHQSEKEMFQMLRKGVYDHTVDNNGTMKDLFNNLKAICNDI